MSETVQALVPLLEYQQSRAHIFPSIESVRWFIRKNKNALIDAGALLEIAGRIKIAPSEFDSAVLEIGKRAIQREAA